MPGHATVMAVILVLLLKLVDFRHQSCTALVIPPARPLLQANPRSTNSQWKKTNEHKSYTQSYLFMNFREDMLSQELDGAEAELGVEKTTIANSDADNDATTAEGSSSSRPMKTTDACAIITGTAVGGGFLAIPSLTSPIGWLPTALGLTLAYGFLVLSAIAFTEAAGLADEDKRRIRQDMSKTGSKVDANVGGTSVASVIRHAFGKKWAVVAGLGFLAQMVAVMTAQVVKGAEILSFMTGLNYRLSCIVPVVITALFVFSAKPEVVERTNLILTTIMIGGFATLIASASRQPGTVAGLLQRAEWMRLLPNTKVAFAMPIFVKLLAFGEAVPLTVERMVLGHGGSSAEKAGSLAEGLSSNTEDARTAGFRRVRKATILGAFIPLILAIIWAGISAALIDPSNPNPIYSLLSNFGPGISIPVLLLSGGAIGTTLLGSFLAMGHFANDMICSKFGYCSLRWMSIANILSVAVPCTLACIGPSLYIPLLAFAGAYPTTLLYGLAPSLAAITLRRRVNKANALEGISATTPQLVPGGERTLQALALSALGLVGASTALALRQLLI